MVGEFCHQSSTVRVGVARVRGEYRLLSVETIESGELLFEIQGELTRCPTRFSVQIEEETHIDLSDDHSLQDILDRFFWRFMNHSCEPNVIIRGQAVIAIRTIQPWEEIVFNYNTTEYEMAEPFYCRCGSSHCQGQIQGFRHISASERERLRHLFAPHLHRLLQEEAQGLSIAGHREESHSR